MAHLIIGLDNAASGAKHAIFESSLRGLEHKRFGREPSRLHEGGRPPQSAPAEGEAPHVSEDIAQLAAVAGALADQYPSADFFIGFDGCKTSTRLLNFPVADLKKVDAMLEFELEDQLPRELDEIAYAATPVFHTKDRTELLVATTAKQDIKNVLAAFPGVGPRALFAEPLAYTVFAPLLAPVAPQQTGVIVDIGHQKTHVMVIENGKPRYARTLREGGARLDRALAQRLEISLDEARGIKESAELRADHIDAANPMALRVRDALIAGLRGLVMGIKQTLQTQIRNQDELQIWLTGGQSQLSGLNELLSRELSANVRPLPLPKELEGYTEAHRYTLAWALAMLGASSTRTVKLDFRRGDFAFRGDTSNLKRQGTQIGAAAAAVVLLAILSGITQLVVLKRDDKQLDDSLKVVTKQLLQREISDFKQARVALEQGASPEKATLPRFSAFYYFGVVSERIPKDLDIHTSELNFRTDRIELKGDAPSVSVVQEVTEKLKGHECFKQVQLTRSRNSLDNTKYEFTIAIDLGCQS